DLSFRRIKHCICSRLPCHACCPFLITPWSVWHSRPRLCGNASRFRFVILSTSFVRRISITLQNNDACLTCRHPERPSFFRVPFSEKIGRRDLLLLVWHSRPRLCVFDFARNEKLETRN